MIKTLYPIFRHWSEKGSVYLISDTHFGDAACKLIDECWPTPEEYIKHVNSIVTKNDTLIHLGDVGDTEWIKKIKAGHKVLILGNHDAPGKCKEVFDEIYTGPLMIAEKIILSHEPLYGLDWCLNIHGHVHDDYVKHLILNKRLNIASNIVEYQICDLNKLIKLGMLKNIKNTHEKVWDSKKG